MPSAGGARRSDVMDTLLAAFDAIALAENYRQEPHVWEQLKTAKERIIDTIKAVQSDGLEDGA